MPRRPRIDLAGYHHVMNRGVNRSTVFVDNDDYEVYRCQVNVIVLAVSLYNPFNR